MIRPTLEEMTGLSRNYRVCPMSREIYSDIATPIQVLKTLAASSVRCFILESVEGGEKWGRYSFLGCDPVLTVRCRDGVVKVEGAEKFETAGAPADVLRDILARYRSPRVPYLPPFTGGLVGYFGYEYLQYAEPTLTFTNRNDLGADDMSLMLFDKVIAFDHLRQKMTFIVNVPVERPRESYERGARELDRMVALIRSGRAAQPERCPSHVAFTPLYTREQYAAKIARVKRHIVEGDVFQTVISNRFEAQYPASLMNSYRVLRSLNPSPYMYYLRQNGLEIAGASPETLVRLTDRKLSTFPIAGTRRRGESEEEDAALEAELLGDSKELSEHNMLVDLGRNDLGRISAFGSVAVKDYLKVQRYSCVMHLTSEVTGRLAEGRDALDALAAVMPAGTLSGAPKVRACQIIEETEERRRGVYGGAIGYIDLSGNMDMCIAIRTAVRKEGKVYVQAGGGIVADSDPDAEYEESRNKAKAIIQAVSASAEVEE